MSALFQAIAALPIVLVIVEYRLLNRTLGRKYSAWATLVIMLMVRFFTGWLNLHYSIAGTVLENEAYYSVTAILMYCLLFRGGLIKVAFINLVLISSSEIIIYLLLPFCIHFLGQEKAVFLKALEIVTWISTILWAVFLEYAGRHFQNLRNDLPHGNTLCLLLMAVFVHVAIFFVLDFLMFMDDGILSLQSTIGYFGYACLGVLLIYYAVFTMDRQVAQCLARQEYAMQTAYFQSREKEWRNMARFRHDMKNHLLCMEGLLYSGKVEEATAYMQTLTQTMAQIETPVRTGNDYADALMGAKYAQAQENGIAISVEMVLPEDGGILPADLCCILSNAMDNALEACGGENAEKDAWITVRSFQRQGQLVIEIRNSLPKGISSEKALPKPGHGFGLENVREAVEKYGGVLDLSKEDCYTFSVLLPMNHS